MRSSIVNTTLVGSLGTYDCPLSGEIPLGLTSSFGWIGVHLELRPTCSREYLYSIEGITVDTTRPLVYPRLYWGSDRWFVFVGVRHWRLCIGHIADKTDLQVA